MSEAALRLWPALPKSTIHPGIYGHFTEHAGRGIYEGIWAGPRSRIPNADGLRLDLIAALKQLRAPVLRWPGGCFAEGYHWRDGIGVGAARPGAANVWGQQAEPNDFGTEEFIRFCRLAGCAPYVCCNVGTGSPGEARDWLEYANFGGDSALTQLRAANGSPEPHGVRYWGVGHEPWGCGGRLRAEDYAVEYARYAACLRALDPGIELVARGAAAGGDGGPVPNDWNHDFCAHMPHADLIGHLSVQRCFSRGSGLDFSDGDFHALFGDVLALERDLERADALLRYFYPGERVGIAVDPWGCRHPEATAEDGLEQPHTLRDALFAGSVLNLLNNWAHRVRLATLAQTVNALHALACARGPDLVLTPAYHVFDMMRPHMDARLLTLELDAPSFEAQPAGFTRACAVPALSASASISGKRILLTVTNQSVDRDIEVCIALREAAFSNVTGKLLTADSPRAMNTVEDARHVVAKRLALSGTGGELVHVFPRHSFTALRFTLD